MTGELPQDPPQGQLLIYQDGSLNLQVRLDCQTVWLPQRLIAELFQVSVKTANEHLVNIYSEGELGREATIRNFRIVQREGSRDDERIKAGRTLGADYFDELLARIRDIRSSERLFYQKITDIYATSIDYDPAHAISQTFFATVQNKLHWAIHGHTAAEVVQRRADAGQPRMGLTTRKSAPSGPIRKTYPISRHAASLPRRVGIGMPLPERSVGIMCTRAQCSVRCSVPFATAGSRSGRPVTRFGTPSRPTCWRTATTSGPCRSCWGMRM